MRILTGLVCLLGIIAAKAQEVKVIDRTSGKPLANVAIFNEEQTKISLTDFEGVADLSIFTLDEPIEFRHISHLVFITTRKKIAKNQDIVALHSDENQLQEVVLSASGFWQNKKDIPQKIISFSKEDVIFNSPQTSADLLKGTGRVYVQKSQLGGGSPMIRGFATNRLLITVDGVRMNTAIFRGGNVQNVLSIDPLSIGHTEVVLGPGSVIYGSDAVGGVMNFFSLSPKFTSRGKPRVSGRAYTRFATANNEKTGHVDVSVSGREWAFLSSLSYSDFDDLRMGSHGPEEFLRREYASRRNGVDVILPNKDPKVQKPTGYDQVNLLEKIRYRPNEEWEFSLGLLYSTTSDYPRYDRLYRKRDGQLRAAEWYYGPQEWLQTNFKINKKGNGALYDAVKLTAAYQYFEESRNDRDFGAETLYRTKEQVDAYSLNLDFEKAFSGNKLFYGIEYVLNTVGSTGSELNILTEESRPGASRYPDNSNWQSIAGYGSFQWMLNDDLALQTGARYNYVSLNADFPGSRYDFPFSEADINAGALTGSAGLNWQQNDFLNWKLNFSTAFRSPNIDDVGKIFDSAPGLVVVPNPNLKPEYAYNSELGVDFTLGGFLVMNLSGYYTLLEDALVRRDFSLNGETHIIYQGESSRIQAIQNAAHARVYGLEVGARLQLAEHLSLSSQLSITDGEEELDNGSKAPLRHAAPLFGNVHLVWHHKDWKFDAFADYNGEFSYEDLAPSEQDKAYLYAVDANGNPYAPEWYTLNFTAQYQISDDWTATASLENITDQRYRTYSSGISAAGRNLILALRYSF